MKIILKSNLAQNFYPMTLKFRLKFRCFISLPIFFFTRLIVHNRVIDITKFLDEHPGGPEVREIKKTRAVPARPVLKTLRIVAFGAPHLNSLPVYKTCLAQARLELAWQHFDAPRLPPLPAPEMVYFCFYGCVFGIINLEAQRPRLLYKLQTAFFAFFSQNVHFANNT